MTFSDVVKEVIAFSEAVQVHGDTELPKRHPVYPQVRPGEDSGPPPLEEEKLPQLLTDLPPDEVYRLALITSLGDAVRNHLIHVHPIAPLARIIQIIRSPQWPAVPQRFALPLDNLADSSCSHLQEGVELAPAEGGFLATSLHLDDGPRPGHHQVEIDIRVAILDIRQIQQDCTLQQPHADRGHAVAHHLARVWRRLRCIRRGGRPRRGQVSFPQSIDQGHECPVDRRCPRPAVGLQHVAIDPQGSLTQPIKIDHRAEASANQPLDLHAPPVDLPSPVACFPR